MTTSSVDDDDDDGLSTPNINDDTNKNEDDNTDNQSSSESVVTTVSMATNEPVTGDTGSSGDKFEDMLNMSAGQMAVIGGAGLVLLLLLVLGIYKYCNREEGSYRIDESKNVGPFAELDMPLNGGQGKKSGKNRRGPATASNKEWFV